MKKLGLMLLLLILPFGVSAASINVKALDTTVDGQTINYKGEMEDGSVAVMCKLYEGDVEIDYFSSAVTANKFEGSFKVAKSGTYKVNCANYEGGEFKSSEAEVVVDTATEEVPAAKSPKTYDAILIAIAVLAISVVGIAVSARYFVKRKEK